MSDLPTYHKGKRNFGTGYDMIDCIEALEAEAEGALAIIAVERSEVMKLREENERLREALSEQSMPCTCHEAYAGRKMQDPECRAGEYGDHCREAIGLPPLCQYNLRKDSDDQR